MHLRLTFSNPRSIEVELYLRMISQKRHGDGTIHNFVRNHVGTKPHPKGIVVGTRVPDRYFLRLPGLIRSYSEGSGWNVLNDPTSRGPGILYKGNGMQFDLTGSELSVFFRGRRRILMSSFATQGIIEGPVFYLSLSALHHQTTCLFPALVKGCRGPYRESGGFHSGMRNSGRMRLKHKLHIGLFEA